MARLDGAVALVTGGGRGIGRAIARGLANAGARVVVAARTQADIDAVAAEIGASGGSARAVPTDVTDAAAIGRLVAATIEYFGAIDVLVNNAGVPGPTGLVSDLSESAWDDTMAVNLKSVFLCCKLALPQMMGRGRGNVINVSGASVHKPTGRVRSVPYQVSKFAVQGLTHGLAIQMRPYGVNVNALQPGPRDTQFHAQTPPEWWAGGAGPGSPDDVVPAAVYLAGLAPGELTGSTIDVRGFVAGAHRG